MEAEGTIPPSSSFLGALLPALHLGAPGFLSKSSRVGITTGSGEERAIRLPPLEVPRVS